MRKGRPKRTLKELEKIFADHGLILMDMNYIDGTKPLKAKSREGYVANVYYANLLRGSSPKFFHSSNPYTIENIKVWMLKNAPDYELLSTKYLNGSEKLLFAKRGVELPPFKMAWRVFKEGYRHPLLSKERQKIPLNKLIERVNSVINERFKEWSINPDYQIEYQATNTIFQLISDAGYKYESTYNNLISRESIYLASAKSPEIALHNIKQYCVNNTNLTLEDGQLYLGNKMKMTFKCPEHGEVKLAVNHLFKGVGCKKCHFENSRGEQSPHWNPNKTMEDRMIKRQYRDYYDWVNGVFERDGYTCQICDQVGGSLNAHHKDGYNWCKERRLDVDNGVTLCKKCHLTDRFSFHRLYGNGNNKKEQYDEWVINYKNIITMERNGELVK